MNRLALSLSFLLVFGIIACVPDEQNDEPKNNPSEIIVTGAAEDITPTSAKLCGYANLPIELGNASFGIIYSTTTPLSVETGILLRADDINTDNMYSVTVTGLTPNTTYYYSSYVQNGQIYRFGSVESFTTSFAPVEEVIISTTELTVDILGGTYYLSATVLPEYATDKRIEWSSSNPNVATVNSNGLVMIVGVGTATITVETVDQGKKASCLITVKNPEEPRTPNLSVKATYFGDYYGKGFQDYILLFQLGELSETGNFKTSGVELSLDVLTATGGPTLFPAGIYEITNDKYNSAGIIPSIKKEEDGEVTYGETYLYTQLDAENYWLDPLESARLEVAVEGAQYTIKVKISVGGEEYNYLYKGTLSIYDKSSIGNSGENGPEGDYDFKADGAVAFNLGHEWSVGTDDWMIYLVNDNDDNEWAVIELVSESGNPEALPEGTFSVPADFYNEKYEIVAGIMCPLYQYEESYYGTYYVFGGEIWYSASSGNVKITKNGGDYTIALNFMDQEYGNSLITSTYTGKVAVDVSEYYDGSLTTARLRKAASAFRKRVVKRVDKVRQIKAASKFVSYRNTGFIVCPVSE